MLAARADLRIEGPGVSVHVHGDGAHLIADVRGDFRVALRSLTRIPGAIRAARQLSAALLTTGLGIEVRSGGITLARLGARQRS